MKFLQQIQHILKGNCLMYFCVLFRLAHFTPDYFTVTVSLDEEVRMVMTPGSSSGTGSLVWKLNHEDGSQTDLSSSVSGNALYISRAKKADHAGIHHYYYSSAPDRGGLLKLIVRGNPVTFSARDPKIIRKCFTCLLFQLIKKQCNFNS